MNHPQFHGWPASQPQQPSGWTGQWPPKAPPVPPPPPRGVDPNLWRRGQWQFNPNFQAVAPTAVPATGWAVHPSWGRPFVTGEWATMWPPNPQKKQSSYWDTELLENPLGLEGMEYRTDAPTLGPPRPPEEAPQTPWVWAPRELGKSPERHDRPLDSHDGHGVRDQQDAHPSHSQSHRDDRQRSQTGPAATSSASRQASNGDQSRPTNYGQIYSNTSSESQSSTSRHQRRESSSRADNVPNSAPPAVPNYQPPTQQGLERRRSTDKQPHHRSHSRDAVDHRRPTTYPPSTTATRHGSEPPEDRSAAYNARQDLQITFSPKIVRTPNHYTSGTVSSASAAAAAAASKASTPTPSRKQSRDDTDSSHDQRQMYGATTPSRSSTGGSSAYTTPSRGSSKPSTSSSMTSVSSMPQPSSSRTPPTLSYLDTFSDEPEELLSPILPSIQSSTPRYSPERSRLESVSGNPSPSASREVSRSQTYPNMSSSSSRYNGGGSQGVSQFSPIPEERERQGYESTSSRSSARTPRPSPNRPNIYGSASPSPYSSSSATSPYNSGTTTSTTTSPYSSSSSSPARSRESSGPYVSSVVRGAEPGASRAQPPSPYRRDAGSTPHPTKSSTSSYQRDRESSSSSTTSAQQYSSRQGSGESRGISRSHTYPNVESTTSPRYPREAVASNRPARSPIPSPNRAKSRGPSPSRSGLSGNPLPPPPMPSAYPGSLATAMKSSSASAAAQSQSSNYTSSSSASHSNSHIRRDSYSTTPLTRSHTQPAIGATSPNHISSRSTQSYGSLHTPSYSSANTSHNTHTSSSHASHGSHSSSATPQSSQIPYTSPPQIPQYQISLRPSHPSFAAQYDVPASSSKAHHSKPYANYPIHVPPYSSASQSTSTANNTPSSSRHHHSSSNDRPRQIRKGYWNKRGDHLLIERDNTGREHMYIVYAPRPLANPPELSQYPAAVEGFLNHEGQFIKYDPNIPELPDSLPLHGEEPKRPYDTFIKYISV
ncbi:hypothetical protein K474DRAFT_1669379 [Panus rudis PR-1116 ss-1]|nr:hypothetical protein K474DRAFT_1669379 [Panus rudis PR-1116 ss-1]